MHTPCSTMHERQLYLNGKTDAGEAAGFSAPQHSNVSLHGCGTGEAVPMDAVQEKEDDMQSHGSSWNQYLNDQNPTSYPPPQVREESHLKGICGRSLQLSHRIFCSVETWFFAVQAARGYTEGLWQRPKQWQHTDGARAFGRSAQLAPQRPAATHRRAQASTGLYAAQHPVPASRQSKQQSARLEHARIGQDGAVYWTTHALPAQQQQQQWHAPPARQPQYVRRQHGPQVWQYDEPEQPGHSHVRQWSTFQEPMQQWPHMQQMAVSPWKQDPGHFEPAQMLYSLTPCDVTESMDAYEETSHSRRYHRKNQYGESFQNTGPHQQAQTYHCSARQSRQPPVAQQLQGHSGIWQGHGEYEQPAQPEQYSMHNSCALGGPVPSGPHGMDEDGHPDFMHNRQVSICHSL